MGGRRPGNLKRLVGAGGKVTGARIRLTHAVASADPGAIAAASARLIVDSPVALKSLLLGLKLTPFIARNAARLSRLTLLRREEALRRAWAAVKQRDGLETSPELDSAVISAAKEALSRRRGQR